MELRRGLIRGELEMKTYILFILRHFHDPIPPETLSELVLDRIDSYFEYADACEALLKSGMITQSDLDGGYQITVPGRFSLQAVEAGLPFSVRQHTVKDIAAILARTRRDSAIKTSVREEDGQFRAYMELSADHGVIFSMELPASDRSAADHMGMNFRKRAERIYLSVVDALMEEEERAI